MSPNRSLWKKGSVTLETMFKCQEKFSSLFFDSESLTDLEKEELTKSLALALHSEVTSLANSINFKDHRLVKRDVDEENILYKSVDAFRYLLAIMNMWGFSHQDFVSAFWDKDLYLHQRHVMEKNKWEGQPVVLVDIDDVLNEFRDCFTRWLREEKDIFVSSDSTEYYSTKEVKEAGYLPEDVFQEYISERGLREVEENRDAIESINKLYEDGFWIQLITARPKENLLCLHDTYYWLAGTNLNFHNLDFSPEKFRWLVQKDFYDADAVVCAIDDSAKHASEYAKHGVPVFSPAKSYNSELEIVDGVILYNDPSSVYNLVTNLYNKE
jgi:hypothetical protein